MAQYTTHSAAVAEANSLLMEQLWYDACVIAAHRALGMGPGRYPRFEEEARNALNWICDNMVSMTKDDPEQAYVKTRVDEELKRIEGDCFHPWEVRYSGAWVKGVYNCAALQHIGARVLSKCIETGLSAEELLEKMQ